MLNIMTEAIDRPWGPQFASDNIIVMNGNILVMNALSKHRSTVAWFFTLDTEFLHKCGLHAWIA